jgi:hypothetical protein
MFAHGGARRLPAPAQYVLASVALLLPVLLPRHVPASDLPSHLYNTWLTLLVREGRAPGLELVWQWSNVLFDWWLEALWRLGGPPLAEKAGVAAAVLVFFWGSFSLVQAITRQPAWGSAPLLGMLAYGWVYHQGFFNYHLSCGFGFWALAFVWKRPARILPAAAALLLAALAHPLGAAAAAGLAGITLLVRDKPWQAGALWIAAACASLAAAAWLIHRSMLAEWESMQAFHVLFATQLRPFGDKYNVFVLGVPLLWLVLIGARVLRERSGILREPAVYAITILAAAILLLPQAIQLPGTTRPLHFVDFRLAVFLTVFVHSLAVPAGPHRVPLLQSLILLAAIVYFGFLGYDYRRLSGAQEEFVRAAQRIPQGGRAVAAATGEPIQMNPLNHMLSKACIGRCFNYGAYAPSSAAFRLRARRGSPVVLDDSLDVDRLQAGRLVVRTQDLPLYGVFLSSAEPFRLKVRPLQAGERIVRQGVRIPPDWF